MELKPCPVCKRPAKLLKLCIPGLFAVECSKYGHLHNTGTCGGEAEAIRRWNDWDGGEWPTKEEAKTVGDPV